MAKYRKDLDKLVLAAENAGWRTEKRAGKHPVLYPNNDHPPIPVPISLSDHRGLMNFRSYLRKAGLDC